MTECFPATTAEVRGLLLELGERSDGRGFGQNLPFRESDKDGLFYRTMIAGD